MDRIFLQLLIKLIEFKIWLFGCKRKSSTNEVIENKPQNKPRKRELRKYKGPKFKDSNFVEINSTSLKQGLGYGRYIYKKLPRDK